MHNVQIIENTEQAQKEYGKCVAGDNGEYVTFIVLE